MYDITIIVPTYNEIETITSTIRLIDNILRTSQINGEILVMDDNSIDGTINKLKFLKSIYPNLNYIVRTKDRGLSQSVVGGFEEAQSSIFLVTDADASHDLSLIPKMYAEIRNGVDLVIGSRYIDGGGISSEWPLKRRVISRGATILGRLLFPGIKDPVSGFFAVRKSVVEHAPLKPKGYKILLEVLGKGDWRAVEEVPYTFNDRGKGSSKLKSGTMVEYALQVIDNALYAIKTRQGHVWNEWAGDFKYLTVGVSGIIVNEGLLIALVSLGLTVPIASIVSIEASRLSNFFGNDLWTFKEGENTLSFWKRFIAHQGVTITGAIVNWVILTALVVFTTLNYKWANLLAILIAFVWNFTGSRKVTWRKEKELSDDKA